MAGATGRNHWQRVAALAGRDWQRLGSEHQGHRFGIKHGRAGAFCDAAGHHDALPVDRESDVHIPLCWSSLPRIAFQPFDVGYKFELPSDKRLAGRRRRLAGGWPGR